MKIKNHHAFETANKLINKENLHLTDNAFYSESKIIDDSYRCTIAIFCKISDDHSVGFTYKSGDKKLKNKTYFSGTESNLEFIRSFFSKKLNLYCV